MIIKQHPEVSKLLMFDVCVNGDIERFRSLCTDPEFDQFNQIYQFMQPAMLAANTIPEEVSWKMKRDVIVLQVPCTEPLRSQLEEPVKVTDESLFFNIPVIKE